MRGELYAPKPGFDWGPVWEFAGSSLAVAVLFGFACCSVYALAFLISKGIKDGLK